MCWGSEACLPTGKVRLILNPASAWPLDTLHNLMRNISGALAKTSAVVRTATSAFFLPFSEYKVFGSEFTHSGFQQYLQGFIQNGAVSFYQPVLANLVPPHAVLFGYAVGIFFVADAGKEWGLDGRRRA